MLLQNFKLASCTIYPMIRYKSYEKKPKPSIHPYDFSRNARPSGISFMKWSKLHHRLQPQVPVAAHCQGRPEWTSFCWETIIHLSVRKSLMNMRCYNAMIWYGAVILQSLFSKVLQQDTYCFWNAMFILARWRAPSDRWSGHRQRQRHPRDLVGIKRDYVTWRREIVEPDLTGWFRGIVALTLNKCKPRSLSQIETHRRSILSLATIYRAMIANLFLTRSEAASKTTTKIALSAAAKRCQRNLPNATGRHGHHFSFTSLFEKDSLCRSWLRKFYKLLPNFLWNLIRILQKVGW